MTNQLDPFKIKKGVVAIWDTRIKTASEIFKQKLSNPLHALHYAEARFLLAMLTEESNDANEAHRLLNTAELSLQDKIKENRSAFSRRNEYQNLLEKSLYSVAIGDIYIMRAAVYLRRGDYLRAAYNIRRSWKTFENNNEITNDETPTSGLTIEEIDSYRKSSLLFGMGVFYFFISLVPLNFLWILEAIGFSADRQKGVQLMQECVEHGGHRAPVALLMLLWIESFFFENLEEAEYHFNRATAMFPNGSMFYYLGGYMRRKQGFMDVAISLFNKAKELAEETRQMKLTCIYELGWCYYLKESWITAIEFFSNFLSEQRAPSFKAYCAYQLGICYHMVGKTEDSLNMFAKVSGWARKHYTFDQYARRKAIQYLKAGGINDKMRWLIRIEILDRAKQHKALLDIMNRENGILDPNTEEWAEYLYWRGRTERSLDLIEECIQSFKSVIDLSNTIVTETYIIPHSLTELGEINLEKENIELAKKYFMQAKNDYTTYDFDKPLNRRISKSFEIIKMGQKPVSRLWSKVSQYYESFPNIDKKKKPKHKKIDSQNTEKSPRKPNVDNDGFSTPPDIPGSSDSSNSHEDVILEGDNALSSLSDSCSESDIDSVIKSKEVLSVDQPVIIKKKNGNTKKSNSDDDDDVYFSFSSSDSEFEDCRDGLEISNTEIIPQQQQQVQTNIYNSYSDPINKNKSSLIMTKIRPLSDLEEGIPKYLEESLKSPSPVSSDDTTEKIIPERSNDQVNEEKNLDNKNTKLIYENQISGDKYPTEIPVIAKRVKSNPTPSDVSSSPPYTRDFDNPKKIKERKRMLRSLRSVGDAYRAKEDGAEKPRSPRSGLKDRIRPDRNRVIKDIDKNNNIDSPSPEKPQNVDVVVNNNESLVYPLTRNATSPPEVINKHTKQKGERGRPKLKSTNTSTQVLSQSMPSVNLYRSFTTSETTPSNLSLIDMAKEQLTKTNSMRVMDKLFSFDRELPSFPDVNPETATHLSYEERQLLDQQLDRIVYEIRNSKLVEIKDRRRYLQFHNRCVKASAIIDWFTSQLEISRQEAVQSANLLIETHRLYPLGTNDKTFRDDPELLLRFQQDQPHNGLMNKKKIWCLPPRHVNIVIKEFYDMIFDLFSHHLYDDTNTLDIIPFKRSKNFRLFSLAISELQQVDLSPLNKNEKKAFFINMYNILVIHGATALGSPGNKYQQLTTNFNKFIEFQRNTFFSTVGYNIGGLTYTLDEIEHGILRENRNIPGGSISLFNNNSKQLDHVMKLDPRIHFCLNSGSKSCPRLQLYTSDALDEKLTWATKLYLEKNVDIKKNEVILSQIFNWYKSDFGDSIENIMQFIITHLDEPKKSCFEKILQTKYSYKYSKYDWSSMYKT